MPLDAVLADLESSELLNGLNLLDDQATVLTTRDLNLGCLRVGHRVEQGLDLLVRHPNWHVRTIVRGFHVSPPWLESDYAFVATLACPSSSIPGGFDLVAAVKRPHHPVLRRTELERVELTPRHQRIERR